MTDAPTTQTVAPIRRGVTVDVPQERAFDVFAADMTSWWPAEHHIGSAPIAEIVVEPRAGGRWYTRHEDGTETSTGYVVAYDRPHRLVVTWQIGHDWSYHDDLVTTIEVRFEADGPDRTRVELEHRDLAAFGEHAAAMKEVFEADDAWTRTMERYAAGTR
jgi:uncharacterized protein YndB with AHSA1/START domain